jgi:DnaK suppressor protein
MQEGQNRKTSSLSILAIAGVEPYQEKPGEEYMNEAQLSHFKRILEAWRNQLRDEVDRTVTHMQDEAATSGSGRPCRSGRRVQPRTA